MSRKNWFLLVFTALHFVAATGIGADLSQSVDACAFRGASSLSSETLAACFGPERPARQPKVAIALSGGGSRSAPFALGVLSAVLDSNLVGSIDVISTISGSSYAGLWFFTRLHERGYPSELPSPTADCLSRRYIPVFVEDYVESSKAQKNMPPAAFSEFRFCPEPTANWCLADGHAGVSVLGQTAGRCSDPNTRTRAAQSDQYRFQNHLRGRQDVLARSYNYSATESDHGFIFLSKEIAKTAISSLAYIPLNFAFDTRLPVSPTRHDYRTGINETYGLTPVDCGGSDGKNCLPIIGRSLPEAASRKAPTFPDLRSDLTDAAKLGDSLPMWVAGATAESRPKKEIAGYWSPRSFFEFTPFGYGSGSVGYYRWEEPEDPHSPPSTLANAAADSGAFFSLMQRKFTGVGGGAADVLMRLFGLEWGSEYSNPQAHHESGRSDSNVWSFVPFPIYYFRMLTPVEDQPTYRVMDGGHSDNLGIFPLIRRGIPNIWVFDSSGDPNYEFGDLCRLRRQLLAFDDPSERLALVVPDLKTFETACDTNTLALSRKAWAQLITRALPVGQTIKGHICPGESETRACSDTPATIHLHILKAAIALNEVFGEDVTMAEVHTACAAKPHWSTGGPKADGVSQRRPTLGWSRNEEICRQVVRRSKCWLDQDASRPNYSCEIWAFSAINTQFNIFPQHDTVATTANSSPWIFGAYRDLGRFLLQSVAKDMRESDRAQ